MQIEEYWVATPIWSFNILMVLMQQRMEQVYVLRLIETHLIKYGLIVQNHTRQKARIRNEIYRPYQKYVR